MPTITFEVYGTPAPRGSKQSMVPINRKTGEPFRRANGGIVVNTIDMSKRSKGWMQEVRLAALEHAPEQLWEGPVELVLTFTMPRPKGHFGTGRNVGVLKANAPEWHTKKPDIDKLVRAILDSLKGAIYRDDSQVVSKSTVKVYGRTEGVRVTARNLDVLTAQNAAQIEAAGKVRG